MELIQVSSSIKDKDTLKRETIPFAKVIKELNLKDIKCTIITEDNTTSIDTNDITIDIINIKEFLLEIN